MAHSSIDSMDERAIYRALAIRITVRAIQKIYIYIYRPFYFEFGDFIDQNNPNRLQITHSSLGSIDERAIYSALHIDEQACSNLIYE